MVMVWQDGERDRWLARAARLDHGLEQDDWVRAATGAAKLSDLTPQQVPWLIAKGPDASARALLQETTFLRHRQRLDIGLVAVARFELDALTFALHEAGEEADRLGLIVLPFARPEVAVLVAGWLRHLGSARLWARLWLDRHRDRAIDTLRPLASEKASRARQNARDALHHLGVRTDGPRPKQARLPGWADDLHDTLSGSRLADAPEPPPGDPVTATSVESWAAAQPMVEPLDVRPDPEAGRRLLDAWVADDMPAAHAWVVLAQAHLGDDATMDRLAPLVRSWPAQGRWARAIDGYAVLATVGSDVSLRHLLAIEENMSGGNTNDRALTYLAQAAAARGLSVTQLADRLAVTHGFDPDVTLDYGPRSFTVRLDESLTPQVADGTGRVLAKPPKPGVKDTRPQEYQRFAALKKEVRVAAASQIARLEKDMLTRRLRPAGDVRGILHPHPILGPLARRLLWGEYDDAHHLIRSVRVAEDGSFADLHDTTADIGPDIALGVVHPADLPAADRAGWAGLFADYEIVQPFPQLSRPAVTLDPAERAAVSLTGRGPVPSERIAGLLNRGWSGNGYENPGRMHTQLAHGLPGGRSLLVHLGPGVPMHQPIGDGKQQVTEIWADETWSDHWQRARTIPLGTCDQAALSELLAELYGTQP